MGSGATATPARQRIITAAIGLFSAKGIRGTSIEEVAVAAGVHRVTVHRIFAGGRDDLVAEVLLARAMEVLDVALSSEGDTGSTTSELIVEALTSFVLLARRDPLISEGIRSDAASIALAPDRSTRLYDMTIAWGIRMAPTAARDRVTFVSDAARVTDLLARTLITLVREPGIVATEADVRAYLTDFIVPAITRPVLEPPA